MVVAARVGRRRKVAKKWIRGPADELAVREGYWFDLDAGMRAVRFVEGFCCQSKGRWAGLPLVLLPWQRDYLLRKYGWKAPDGLRRYRRSYLEVAKKNGKSTMTSGESLEQLVADGEPAPEVYIAAVDREQASIVYDEAARMVQASPDLSKRLTVLPSKKRILDLPGNGKLITCSADVPSKDGINASAVTFDELHRQKSRDMWDVFEYAGASRDQPMLSSITTAGEDEMGVWFEQRTYSEKVNAGVIPDVAHLGVVYRALETDDLEDPRVWRKANPSLGHTISVETFRREMKEARLFPSKWANFLRLRLNIVTHGDKAYLSLADWDRCDGTPTLGGEVYGGLDLSSIDDLTALAMISADEEGGVDLVLRFWLPKENIVRLEQKHQVPYRAWAGLGLITLTPGNVVDYEFIRAELKRIAESRRFRKLLLDPWNARQLGIQLQEDGFPVEEIRQGYASLSAPTKELRRLVLAGQLRHGGHPILRWMASNAIAVEDPAGNVKLDKSKGKKKIDGMSATVNALAGLVADRPGATSVYEKRGILVI